MSFSAPWNITNPGINIPGLLTSAEQSFVTNLVNLSYATGDILYYNGTSLTRLPIGTANKVLTVISGLPSWQTPASGFADPLTTNGDIIARIAGVTTRLAQGSNGQFLGVSGGVLGYYTPSGAGLVDSDYGDIVVSGSGTVMTIDTNVVGLTKLAQIATDSILGRATAATGNVEVLTALPFAFTGDVTRPADSNVQTIAASAVTLAKMADVATATVFYRKTSGTGVPEVQTLATLKTDLGLTGTNSGDQTSIVGITGTKAQFNIAVTDGDIFYIGDTLTSSSITDFNEAAQDAIGTILTDSSTIDFTYNDTGNTITAIVIDNSITNAKLAQVATATFKGRVTAAIGNVEDITGTQATTLLDVFTSGLKGLAPASGGGTTNFLRADGTWAAPPGGGGGSGDVVGPASATDNALSRFDGATGKLIQNSGVIVGDANDTTITIANNANVVGLTIQQNDSTNDKLALEINAKGSGAAKVTFSTLVQYNDTDGNNSDWSFNVAGDSYPVINLQSTGGTLSSPTATTNGWAGVLQSYFYNSANTQKLGSAINYRITDNTSGSEDTHIELYGQKAGVGGVFVKLSPVDGVSPAVNDGIPLGTSALGFSDLFLASGGVVNFNNGNAILTHSAGLITSNVDIVVPTEVYGVGWNGSNEVPTKDALYDKIESMGSGGNTFNTIYIDQSGGTSDTYGVLSGTINGSNALFTVSQSSYATGTLKVWLNGQLQTQGTGEDFTETTPGSGTFTFLTAPLTGDLITVEYQKVVVGAINKGIAEVDFGSITSQSDIATVTVSNTSIATTSYPNVSMYALATTDHDPDDYMAEGLIAYVTNVINATSFDISVRAPNLTWGKYKVTYQF